MALLAVPVKEDKLGAWEELAGTLGGAKKEEFADFNRRYALTRHAVWLAKLPSGPIAVVLIEGPGANDYLPRAAASTHEFDRWLAAGLAEVHGIDFTKPPPGPMPELKFDSRT